MNIDRKMLDHAVELFPPPERSFDRLARRRDRKQRNRRTGTIVLALTLAVVTLGVTVRAFQTSGSAPASPADTWSVVPNEGGVFDHRYLQAVTLWNNEYVAVGAAAEGSSPVLTSGDGIHWSVSAALGPSAVAWDIMSDGSKLIVVGNDDHSPVVWLSEDATTWTRGTIEGAGGSFWAVTVGGPGYIGVGTSADDGDGYVWTSTDGLEWTPVPQEGVFGGLGDQWVGAIVPGGPGYVAAGWDRPPGDVSSGSAAVWISTDGVSWSRVEGQASLESDGFTAIDDLIPSSQGLLGVGTVDASFRPEVFSVGVWTSSDGTTWRRLSGNADVLGDAGEMSHVVGDGPGLVGVGQWFGPGGATSGRIWTSTDGTTWTQVPGDPFVPQDGGRVFISSIANGPAGLVAVGFESIGSNDVVGRVWTGPQNASDE